MRVYISEAVLTASGEMVHSVLASVNKNSYSLFKSSEEKLYEQVQQFSDLWLSNHFYYDYSQGNNSKKKK